MVLWLAGLAAPSCAVDLASYYTAEPDRRIRELPADVASGIFSAPEVFVKPLVDALTKGVTDELLKAKILHDWIAVNIQYDKTRQSHDYAWTTTLRSRTAVCGGYAKLMSKLCEEAGVECQLITGKARGSPYGEPESHAWNAVRVDGVWHLVDVTWSSGDPAASYAESTYRGDFLYLAPEAFIYTHLPDDERWQLIGTPRNEAQWNQLPHLYAKFFRHGLSLTAPLTRSTRTGARVQFSLESDAGITLMAHVAPKGAKKSDIPRRAIVSREENGYRVLASFPSAGSWVVSIYCKAPGDTRESLEMVGLLEFESSAGDPLSFPRIDPPYADLQARLDWPLSGRLEPGLHELQIRIKERGNVWVVVGNKEKRLQPLDTDPTVYRTTVKVTSPGQEVLVVDRSTNHIVLQYGDH